MAADGLTVTQKGRTNVIGSRQMVTLDLECDDGYVTGGYNLDLDDYVGTIDMVMCEASSQGQVPFYDRTNKKLKLFGTITSVVNDTDSSANATDLSGELEVGSTFDELENATDLTNVTITIVVYGTRA